MPNPAQTNATLIVNKTTGAIEAPVSAAAFAAANDLATAGAPEAHASTHAAAGSDPVALSKSQVGLGNVDNTSDASKPVSTAAQTALDLKAPLASPALTGTPTVPTAAQGTNTTQAASTAFVRTEVAALVDASPGTLDTLNELAAALGDDPDFAATTAAAIAAKADAASTTAALALKAPLASPALTGAPTAPTAAVATDNTQIATTAFVHDAIAEIPAGGVTSVDGATGAVETGYADRITALENIEPTASGSNLVSGGGVSLTGGLTLTISAAIYNILGVAQSSVETILTAATADPTNPRYDVVALDDTGTAVLITGTPAATPVVPTVDPATQLYITQISIPAGATSITGTETVVYDSNDDYTMTEQGTSIVLDSTNNPFGGSGVCIEATNMAAGDYFQAQTPSGTIDLGTFNVLRFRIRNKAAWHASKQIAITARSSGVQVGQAVVFKNGLHAFDGTVNFSSYQHIALNPNLFAASGQPINQLRWTCAGGGTAIPGFYVDDISLQAGVAQVTDSTRLRDRGAHSTALQYDVNDLAYSGAIIYKALQQTPVGIAATNTTYWTPFAIRNPMTTAGDSIVGGTDGAPTRLALGSALQVRRVNAAGTSEEFAAPASGGSKTLYRWAAHEGFQPASNYATFDTRNARPVMDFDASTSESLLYYFKLPEGADLGSGIRVITEWKATSATSGNIGTSTSFERGNTDADADSFATALNSSGVAVSGTSGISVFVTTDHTSSEIDGLAAGESGILKVARNTAVSSNHTADAELIGVEIQQLA